MPRPGMRRGGTGATGERPSAPAPAPPRPHRKASSHPRSCAPPAAADAAAWNEARGQWRNWKAIERASTGAGSATAEGYLSPSQLRTAVVGQGRGAYARGEGDLAELARAGEAVLRPLPQSGTAPRAA